MKYKCTNCGKSINDELVVIECPDCYASGWKKEGFIEVKEVLKLINEMIKLENMDFNKLKEKLNG